MANAKQPRRRAGESGLGSAAAEVLDAPGAKMIVDAAIAVMTRHGYHGTSIREIAEAAGMSNAALYHHFASKQELLFLIMERGLDELLRVTREALDGAGDDPVDQLRAVVTAHVTAHTIDRSGSFIGNNELRSLDPDNLAIIVAKRDQQQQLFVDVVERGIERAMFETPYPKDAARAIVTMCTAVAGWYHPGGALTPEMVAERYGDMALRLVGYRPPST